MRAKVVQRTSLQSKAALSAEAQRWIEEADVLPPGEGPQPWVDMNAGVLALLRGCALAPKRKGSFAQCSALQCDCPCVGQPGHPLSVTLACPGNGENRNEWEGTGLDVSLMSDEAREAHLEHKLKFRLVSVVLLVCEHRVLCCRASASSYP